MILLDMLLCFILGFTLGKKSSCKRQKRKVKKGEIVDIKSFLSYDGSEQKN